MSREIKFRAWDKDSKTMIDSDSLAFEEYLPLCELLRDSERQCFMQYTGLHDKNFKEIYEGDIVEFSVFDYNGTDTQYKGVVKFAECELQIWKTNESEFYGCDGAFSLFWIAKQDDEIEVIGNIYENAELLEEE